MNAWRPYPLLRLVIPFVAGIVAEIIAGSFAPGRGALIFLLFLSLLFLLAARLIFSQYGYRWLTGLAINLFLGVAGFTAASVHRVSNNPDWFANMHGPLYVATIAEPPAGFKSGQKAILKVDYARKNGSWQATAGQAIGYLKCAPGERQLQFGDRIILHAGFETISDNSNPHTFNYAQYLQKKGIMHRVYADPWDWNRISMKPAGVIRKFALDVRNRLLDILRENHVEGREFAVAGALLLGYVDDLDNSLRHDYAATGAMHILSVSGMHVGVIYLFLEFLLGFMNKSRTGRAVKAVLILALIWFYALLTGLSPCVLRSAAMLSLPVIGKSMSRSPDMYNILAASIIFILAFDPFLVLDIGFQLSYLAVGGILLLYKPVYDLYVTSAWLPDKIWSILAVSIAAQIATLPITLYIFHQFPNYFMVTNIFVVPLSSLVIYAGIAVLAFGSIPIVAALTAKLLIFLVWLLNSIIHLVGQLPYSTIRGIFISAPEMMTLYVLIVALFLLLTTRRTLFLYLFLLAAIALNLFEIDTRIRNLRTSAVVVFNAPGETLVLFRLQDKALLVSQALHRKETLPAKTDHSMAESWMDAAGTRYRRHFDLQTSGGEGRPVANFLPLAMAGNHFVFQGYRIIMLHSAIPKALHATCKIDLLLITGNPKISLSEAIATFRPAQIVADATNSRYKIRQWKREADSLGVQFHAVIENGAFEKLFFKDVCSLIKIGYFCSTFEDR